MSIHAELIKDIRIGPPAVNKKNFIVERNGRRVKGKREEIPKYLSKLGLNLYEYNAGRGIKFKAKADLEEFRKECEKYDLMVTLHAPYYISLCSDNPETLKRSIERIGESLQAAVWLNAKRIVVHPGSYGKKRSKQENLKLVIKSLKEGIEKAYSEDKFKEDSKYFKDVYICPETMGKLGQLGTVEEVITICKEVGTDKCIPTIDFGHIYARSLGKIKDKNDFMKIFEMIEKELGSDVVKYLHIHYSHVEYTQRGEKEHHPNSDTKWGPKYEPLLELIWEAGYHPTIVVESPDLEDDAVQLMKYYKTLQNG
ncbi:MAG: TIM barrel protein [Promethearchaeota archaeon]